MYFPGNWKKIIVYLNNRNPILLERAVVLLNIEHEYKKVFWKHFA